jgi:hypothetical protein
MTDHIQGSPEWFTARLGKVPARKYEAVINKLSAKRGA